MRSGAAMAALLALAACEGGTPSLGALGKGGLEGAASGSEPIAPDLQATGGTDVEAPEVFKLSDKALWDGRPSLGGVWVAHASVQDPERVLISNPASGKSVIGALFRREIDNPGPSLQLSSDAAEALGMLAGQPATISIVALRRVEPKPPAEAEPVAAEVTTADAAAKPAAPGAKPAKPGAIETTKIDPIATTAAAAIDKATKAKTAKSATPAAQSAAKPAAAAAAPTRPAAGATIKRPYVQIGIFSVEANARKAADQMQKAGMAATVKPDKSGNKTFWRVIIGPVGSAAERDAMAAKVKGLGYPDSYAVSN
jgi:rare lipoprotein A